MRLLSVFLLRILIIIVLPGQVLIAQAEGDHDEARRLLNSGDILSLEVILEKLRSRYPGKILEVEFKRKPNHIVYEVEILGDDGAVREVYIDAKTGDVLRNKVDN
ncbi:MAG: PepSY domain-containing protein [Gammaproteobacteria bacterium]|nr:MAG: PepSY domain-containing protein [Gammaproteobacteria bacterium]